MTSVGQEVKRGVVQDGWVRQGRILVGTDVLHQQRQWFKIVLREMSWFWLRLVSARL